MAEAEARAHESKLTEEQKKRLLLDKINGETEKWLAAINDTFNHIEDGVHVLLNDRSKLVMTVGGVTALAAGVYTTREGSKVMWGYINRILGQPSLIRESSIAKFPWSGLASRGVNRIMNYSTAAAKQTNPNLGDVILHPKLQRRVEQLARATANTKAHEAPFRNMLFYGPPGTGKTMVAREIARKSNYERETHGNYLRALTKLTDSIVSTPSSFRCNSTASTSQNEFSVANDKGFKGHEMLAPFTAGWQSSDLNPLVIEKSEGSYVFDVNGKKYLDSLAGLWCTALGGSEPRLVAAANKQLNTLPFYHSFWNRTTKPSLDLAKELIEMFTASKMSKAFFTNSGSEANDTQVKLVWYYNNALGRPNKKKFIARSKSYHGSTLIAASLSGLPALHQKFDLPAPFVLHTDCPHYWRYHLPGETEEEFSTRLANNLENLILKEGPETIAAFIAEPVMGAGGVIPPPATYFEKIQKVVKKYDILFIADEVICAFGRLGTMFGCDKYNIKPDLVSMAKALSSAYMPIGAVLVSPEVSDVIYSQSNKLGSFSHGFTYSGHPVSCAVALEALKIYKDRNIIERVNTIAPKFQDGLKAFSGSPIIGEIRGTGLILATEFTDNKSPNDVFPPEWGVGAYFGAQCEKHGMLVRVAGDNIMMSPPFIITPEEVAELISIYGKALKATEEKVAELKSQQT